MKTKYKFFCFILTACLIFPAYTAPKNSTDTFAEQTVQSCNPWVSSIFVAEEYRGRRISEKLIEAANQYAKSLGFKETYIPSEHIGLYEKYGYHYVKDIVNYGNGIDRLYVKQLG